MKNPQKKIPLLTILKALAKKKDAPFYTPGHKKGQGINKFLTELMGDMVFRADLPELPELDNLFAPEGVIKEAQNLAASAFGALETWFLVNGSTSGIIASILATCGEGDKIILPRNIHQSAIFGLILSGATPIFINPEYNSDFDFFYTISPSQITDVLENNNNIKAVMVVSPTYHGICANLTEIAHITHNFNIPLLVDEAHGAHFSFHSQLPRSSLQSGADIAIQSTHKVLGAMTQASMIHLQGNLVDRNRLSLALQLVQSSSPSYLLLASLDGARQQMALDGEDLLTHTINLANIARKEINKLEYLSLLELVKPTDFFADLDITRLTINVSKLGLTGYEVDEILHEEFGVTCELPSLNNLTFIISIGNTLPDIERLIESLKALKKYHNNKKLNPKINNNKLPLIISEITPRQAYWAEKKVVLKELAIDRISGENICPYPPGIPLIMAGEIITKEALNYLEDINNSGGIITGISDKTLNTFKIIS
ncbi:aminotransferase class I/II-fold pyridoxal phosphate-dependent enzyme [Geminocystis sp. NIES-3709]|uniref:aminotransferase class I/II-fold pyridoxal phosphate-dependent enzyme n=1 Tax=Geminocystis sp. NIES-3709 TaxID=1617448 RepID=UPI0005FC909A|nr:aminotransferase class I/II-fold pyridoxal phosphate-dependent enzyme [Geminocystis sp. NIES-3709]BAQ63345.1 lysine decarboxylase [Geminocystis sp. NIES-3709]